MIKRYLFFCQLTLLPALAAQAQFTTGSEGFFVSQGTSVTIDSLTLIPSTGFLLSSQTLTISPTPLPGSPPGIARVYQFSTPVDFAGEAGFFYLPSELNGNTESSLQLAHGNTTFESVTGSTVDVTRHYISNTLPMTNFTSLTAAQDNALPVTLIGFEVKKVENMALLSWQTSGEQNSDYFEVQQSPNLKQWAALGKVSAAGESAERRDYSFRDPIRRSGMQYYRLKMVDSDGTYAYSMIRNIEMETGGTISAFPNPVVDKLVIGSQEALTSVKVTSLSGQVMLEVSKPQPGREFSMKQYPAGTYLVQVQTAAGKTQAIKIVKQ
ncbi:Por secretion system C-terminal sorting domain-containing protein [Dyadobacter soli]|uniref:Por secretion system C-terminal sorting domain-containing protein n=1 Tax=Dyadobacter soli TaxID=659014 RepID=A0A1G7T1Y9_9BACT|nr:T9SS type A sorting domain-containing protein [Dyadobacter soli]SDG29102.1 Por secretion system C-terminal sorting domain-containing protein [Dyadobacter soli]